jgi:hypothetical protein
MYFGWEEDEYGDTWVYCELCDVWTAHPKETVEKFYADSIRYQNASS